MSSEGVYVFMGLAIVIFFVICLYLSYDCPKDPSEPSKPSRCHPEVQEALAAFNASWFSLQEIYRVNPRKDTVEVKVAEDMDHNREILDRHEAKIAEALTKLESAAAALRETRARVYARKKPIEPGPNGSARIKLV